MAPRSEHRRCPQRCRLCQPSNKALHHTRSNTRRRLAYLNNEGASGGVDVADVRGELEQRERVRGRGDGLRRAGRDLRRRLAVRAKVARGAASRAAEQQRDRRVRRWRRGGRDGEHEVARNDVVRLLPRRRAERAALHGGVFGVRRMRVGAKAAQLAVVEHGALVAARAAKCIEVAVVRVIPVLRAGDGRRRNVQLQAKLEGPREVRALHFDHQIAFKHRQRNGCTITTSRRSHRRRHRRYTGIFSRAASGEQRGFLVAAN